MTHSVLIVDDDELIRALVRRVFERAGYAVRCAQDGIAAVGAIETDRPDVIVSDVRMPRLDGLGLVARLAERGDGIPIVLMSGDRLAWCPPGVVFVPKPFRQLADLVGAVRTVLTEGVAAPARPAQSPAS